jgi:hypothetical protein
MGDSKLKYKSVSTTKKYIAQIVNEKKTYVFQVEVYQAVADINIHKAVSLRRMKFNAADCKENIRPRTREMRIRKELTTYFEQK